MFNSLHLPKIVIADDEPDLLKVIEKRLSDEGYIVYTALNGKKALDLISEVKPDVAIIDVMMPYMTGFEIKESLNKNKETADIPVIFLTAKTMTADMMKGLDIGAVEYIMKPFEISDILSRIERLLS